MTDRMKRPAALKYLQDEGWEVAKTRFYDAVKAGFPALQADKTLLTADLNAYARAYLKRKAGHGEALVKDQAEKTNEEVLKLRAQRQKLELELGVMQKKYLPRADFAREMAARARVLDTYLRHHFRSHVGKWIALVGGDAKKLDTFTTALDEALNQALNRFATLDQFQVMILDGESDDE